MGDCRRTVRKGRVVSGTSRDLLDHMRRIVQSAVHIHADGTHAEWADHNV